MKALPEFFESEDGMSLHEFRYVDFGACHFRLYHVVLYGNC